MLVKLKNVRLSYPNLFEARDYEGDKNFKYNAQFLMAKGSDTEKQVRKAIKDLATEAWKGKAEALLKSIENNAQKCCFRDGDLKEQDEYAGNMFISASNKIKPTIIDRNPEIRLTAEDGRPYGGCYVNANVDIYAHTKHKAIFCTLLGVQFVKDGDAFSGGRPASPNDFDDLSVEDDEDMSDIMG